MNERISDLKEQSLLWAIETLDPDLLNDNEWAVAIDEKFAELIVRECISIVEPTSHHQAFAQGYMGGVDGLELLYGKVEQIKENFGVKE